MSDETILPIGKVLTLDGNKVTGVLHDVKIKCPVVEQNKKRRGRNSKVEIPRPSTFMDNIQYNPNQTLEMIEKQYILLALKHHQGNISLAARSLKISKMKVYRALGRKYY